MDPNRLRRLFAAAETELTPFPPPLATITARAARRRDRRTTVAWIASLTAAAAVAAVVLAVNLAGARSAPDSLSPGPAVSGPSTIGSTLSAPTPDSAPATRPGASPSADARSPVRSMLAPTTPAAPGMRWVTQSFGTDQPAASVQAPAGWKPYRVFVGQTGGAEWVNPSNPSQRIAVVLGQCMSCQQPELTHDPTVRSWLIDSSGGLVQADEATVQWTSIADDGQQGYFTDTAHVDDFCLNGDPGNPASGMTHEPYVALGYIHLVQTPIVEPIEVFVWAPTDIAHAVIDSVTFGMPIPTGGPTAAAS